MTKNVLILGAGVYHIPLVQRIQKLGHKAWATSYLTNDPALALADVGKNISSTQLEALEACIEEDKIDAILTTASDWNTFSQAELNARFGFKGVRPLQVNTVSEKFGFNLLLKKLALPHVSTQEVVLSAPLFENYKKLGKHIFKPLKGSGSADVFTTDNVFPKTLEGQRFLAQEYIKGQELGAQALVENGKVIFLALSKKYLVNEVVPLAHVVGTQEVEKYKADVTRQLNMIVNAIDFDCGTINLDIRVNNEVAYIIDLSLRLSGNGLIEAINTCYEVDLFTYHVKQILDEKRSVSVSSCPQFTSSIVYGTVSFLGDLIQLRKKVESQLANAPIEVRDLIWDNVNQSQRFTKSKNRIGHVVLTARSEEVINQVILETKQILGFN